MKYTLNQSLTLTHSTSLTQFMLTPLASLALRSRYALAPRTRSRSLPPTGGKCRHHPDCAQAANAAITPPIRGVRF